MKKLIFMFLLAMFSVVTFGQSNLKVRWDEHKIELSLPYPANTGHEIDEFDNLYVYSSEYPLSMYVSTNIDNKDVNSANYKEVFIESLNGKEVTSTMLDNGFLVVQFKWDSGSKCAAVYLLNDKTILCISVMDDNGEMVEFFKKIRITKR